MGCLMSVPLEGNCEVGNTARLPSVRGNELRAPLCAQCHAAMTVILGEPDFQNPSLVMATYRCAQCGLLGTRANSRLITDGAVPN
jgi:hypothetical protein